MESSPPKKRSAVAVETKNGSGRKKKKVKKKNRTSGASNLPDLFTEVKKTDNKAICTTKCKCKGIGKHYIAILGNKRNVATAPNFAQNGASHQNAPTGKSVLSRR